ncbi:MAG: glycosyltransferase family 2 protein [Candidatus Diapherotrites archaeon]|nr:glycosyltransferase family 2 protein [Candidatus Diapherotrites archaeon]
MSFGLNPDSRGLWILKLIFIAIPLLVIASFMLPLYAVMIGVNFILLYLTVLFVLIYLQNPEEPAVRSLNHTYSLAVLVPCFNSKNTIRKCISSIQALAYPLPFRIIVADDGSTDGTRDMLREMNGIELLELPHRGKGFALNDGLNLISEEAVVCIDSDTYPEPDVLMKLVGYLDDPAVGAVNGRIVPDQRRTFIQKVQNLEYLIAFGYWHAVLSSLNSMSYVTGPLTVFRRSALQTVGYYFDTRNLAEDMEIGLRLQAHGYKIKACMQACSETDVPDSLPKLAKQRDRWYRSRVYNLILYRRLFFNSTNPELGFFGLPYLFMVELLMIVVLLRVTLLLASSLLEWLNFGSILFFSGNLLALPPIDLTLETQLYFFIATLAVVSFAYFLGLRLAGYRVQRDDLLPLLFQFTLYPYFIALVYLRGIIREIRGARPIWERVSF